MIISMFDILCVTNRALVENDFLAQIENIAKNSPAGIILREKDLSESEYKILAMEVMNICNRYNVTCILHNFIDVAIELRCEQIHLALPVFRNIGTLKKSVFSKIGVSCHSVAEAIEAQNLGAGYITAGHVFATNCKKGVPPRGLDFLNEICHSVSIPVYAIGGIDDNNIDMIRDTKAKGACIMSGFMCCNHVEEYMRKLV